MILNSAVNTKYKYQIPIELIVDRDCNTLVYDNIIDGAQVFWTLA